MLSKIRLELARGHDHPQGAGDIGYEFAAPLDGNGKIDADAWHKHRAHCRVVRFRPDEDDDIGHLVRKPGGSWAFHYDIASGDEEDDEAGYRFGDHAFRVGEYVSIREDEGLRTFRVVRVQPVPTP
jgi:hypothetical protein